MDTRKKLATLGRYGAVASFAALPVASFAVPIDTTGVVTAISDLATPIAAVGGAFLVVAAVAVGYKWLKGTIFG